MHTIYVLKSEKDDNLYIGCTSDLISRLKMHQSGNVRSTKGRLPVVLIYKEDFNDKYIAFNMERFYKTAKGKKALKEKLNHYRFV